MRGVVPAVEVLEGADVDDRPSVRACELARDDGVVRGDDAVGLREAHRLGHALERETAVPVASEVVGKVGHQNPALLDPVNQGEVDVSAREDVVIEALGLRRGQDHHAVLREVDDPDEGRVGEVELPVEADLALRHVGTARVLSGGREPRHHVLDEQDLRPRVEGPGRVGPGDRFGLEGGEGCPLLTRGGRRTG
ncbi:MAG: hypothetical protein K6U08_00035 [Firmicutes bacterium]|nr:hypothetical protein [Bacillota bacterium]